MNEYLAILVFVALMALLYFVVLGDHGVVMRRLRKQESRHDRMVEMIGEISEAKDTRSQANHQPTRPGSEKSNGL